MLHQAVALPLVAGALLLATTLAWPFGSLWANLLLLAATAALLCGSLSATSNTIAAAAAAAAFVVCLLRWTYEPAPASGGSEHQPLHDEVDDLKLNRTPSRAARELDLELANTERGLR